MWILVSKHVLYNRRNTCSTFCHIYSVFFAHQVLSSPSAEEKYPVFSISDGQAQEFHAPEGLALSSFAFARQKRSAMTKRPSSDEFEFLQSTRKGAFPRLHSATLETDPTNGVKTRGQQLKRNNPFYVRLSEYCCNLDLSSHHSVPFCSDTLVRYAVTRKGLLCSTTTPQKYEIQELSCFTTLSSLGGQKLPELSCSTHLGSSGGQELKGYPFL